MLVFLALNGVELCYQQGEIVSLGLSLATGKVSCDGVCIGLWSIRNSALLSTHNLTLCRNIRVETMDSTAPQNYKIRAQKARMEGKARCCRPYRIFTRIRPLV